MAGATLELDLEVRRALRAATAAGASLKDPRALLRELGELLLPIHRRRFRAQQSPDGDPWAPLSPAYRRRKRRNRNRILVLRGQLSTTLRYQIQGGDLLFGTNLKDGATHQFGRGAIPARPWLGIGRDDALRLERAARDHVSRALRRGNAR
jgi:phage virion morphogenesis protein